MALTKVSGHVIDQPFDVGIITATNSYVSGIGTFGNIRVLGDLQVDGSTTTLDTVVTEVDRLEVAANNTTVAIAVTQSGNGAAAYFMGGNVGIGTDNPFGKLQVHAGNDANFSFSTATGEASLELINDAGSANVPLNVRASEYKIKIQGNEKVRITSDGNIGIGSETPGATLDIAKNTPSIRFTDIDSGKYAVISQSSSSFYLTADRGNGGGGNIIFRCGGVSEKLRITSDDKVKVPDNGKFTAGADDDLQIYHDGGHSRIVDAGTGYIKLQSSQVAILNSNDSAAMAQFYEGGAVELYHNNSKKLETTSGGVTVTGTLIASANLEAQNNIQILDNKKLLVGNANDLQIYHDGSNSYIDETGTGRLNIRGNTGVSLRNYSDSEQFINCYTNGTVEIFYDNIKKLETTTTGAKVTGALEVTQEYPSIRPTLDLNFAATKTLDRRITFTRDSLGTYTDELGIVRTAFNNTPRFDHDPVTGESLGLLIEESRTNDILNSQVFTSGYNTSGLNTITQNTTVTTPEGLTDGVGVITESSGGTVHQFYEASSAQITGIRTYSIFVKPNGRNYCVLRTSSFTHDLVNGTTLGSASGEYVSATTTKFANGWVRCTLTQNHSNTYDQFNFKLAKDGHQDYSYSGDGTSGVYVWGAQLEAGSFPTSYIPTSGSTVTRAQDTPLITGTNFTDFYNQSEGTLVLSADIAYLATSNQAAVVFEDTSSQSTDLIALGYRVGGGSSGNLGSWYQGNSTAVAYLDHNAGITANTEFRQTFAYKKDDLASVVNGTTPLTDNSGTLSTSIDRVRFGEYYADGITSGHIRQFKYYNKRLPNAQLQGLTQQ